MKRRREVIVCVAGSIFLAMFCGVVPLGVDYDGCSFRIAFPAEAPAAYAADTGEVSPYGDTQSGEYGEKRTVQNAADAMKVLKEYFSKKDVKIGEIREKKLYFEADILDRNNRVVDKVIVDKRTGRIRSIY
jgi:hypothetical protein